MLYLRFLSKNVGGNCWGSQVWPHIHHVQTWLEDVGRFQPRNLLVHHTGMKLTRLVLYLKPMLLWWQQIWGQKMTIGIRFYVSTGACGLSGVGCQWYHISPAKFYYVMLRGLLFNWSLVMKYKSHRVPSSQVHSNGRKKNRSIWNTQAEQW